MTFPIGARTLVGGKSSSRVTLEPSIRITYGDWGVRASRGSSWNTVKPPNLRYWERKTAQMGFV
jgi:hypothetical protein